MKVDQYAWGFVVKDFKRGYHISASWHVDRIDVFGPDGIIDSWSWHAATNNQRDRLRTFKWKLRARL